ncbi:MAG: hypothetical protein BBJ57_13615 [Desulfobacterales bacterium PC51MH44]|jgi:amino acid adenylation domain-containing protein|nr:MAG: hypothetical protein BBJ57_13615 [Desulfobacterales bacterium PC51MH44]
MIDRANLKDVYPLSPMQEGMLFHALYNSESSAYIEQSSYCMAGDLDVNFFQQSWNELFKRHDILRTVFAYEKTSRPLQVVLKHSEVEFYFEDLREKGQNEQNDFLNEYRIKDRRRSFNLGRGPLLRVAVFHLEKSRYKVMRIYHHILMDGWSSGILLKELLEIYNAFCEKRSPCLPEVVPYSTYIKWIEKQDKEASKQYWKKYMYGCEEVATIPSLQPYNVDGNYEPEELSFNLDKEQTDQLNKLAAGCMVTLSTIVQALWGIILGRYNDRKDVVFGTVVSGRPPQVEGIEDMAGLFINTVPVRIRFAHDDTFVDLLQQVQKEALESGQHLFLPLAVSQQKQGIIDHITAFENYPIDKQLQAVTGSGKYGLDVEKVKRFEHTNYNFSMIINPGTRLHIVFQFNQHAFAIDQIERMAGHLKEAVNAVLAKPRILVDEINILSSDERKEILTRFNDTDVRVPGNATIISLFEEQAVRYPEHSAIVWQNKQTGYGELNQKTDELAHYLNRQYNIQIEDRVAVILDRSDMLIISLLGILKAGGVYVPIDPSYPKDRIEFMIADSGSKVVLTDSEHLFLAPAGIATVELPIKISQAENIGCRLPGINSHNLAYVIYTSGSTGRPKAVMIEHRSIINLVMWHRRWYGVNEKSRATLVASPGFDASVWEMLPYLLSGAFIYPVSNDNRNDTEKLIGFYKTNSITHSFVSPTICEEICRTHLGRLAGCITLLTGGDVLKEIGDADIQVVNNYGPTECTVVATSIFLCSKDAGTGISIGRPIDNTRIFILDSMRRPVPIGIPGEIYIGGAGLARGYLNQKELTEKRFIQSPFQAEERLYRTGDIGKWLHNGNIRFLGRNDDQVKIRGFRVEPGEIEHRFLEHPLITEAIVTAQEGKDSSMELIGYIVAGEKISVSALREHLLAALPDYMVPRHFVQMDKLPITSSGKINRNYLPVPDVNLRNSEKSYAGPRTFQEQLLTEIWTEVLGLETIGIYDNFFELGGHSLSATRVISCIRGKFQTEISLRMLFEKPTIAELAAVIESARDSDIPHKPPTIVRVSRQKHRRGDMHDD